MVNKFWAALLIVLATVLTGLAGWGLIYLPDQMKAEARRNIADLRAVLARDAPGLKLAHGAISANPFTARVSVADVSLGRPGRPALTAKALGFTIDPFSRRLSAVDATILRLDRERAQLRIDRARLAGLTPETLGLLQEAARGEVTVEQVVRLLNIPSLALTEINVTAPREGEMNLRRITIENLEKGIVGELALEGFSLYSRAGRNPGEFALDRAALTGLNFGEIATAIAKRTLWPHLTVPLIKDFSFEGMRAESEKANFSVRRGSLEAVYGTNDAGRPYARRARFAIEDISIRPGGRSDKLRDFLKEAGLARLEAEVKMVSSGDHGARTMAIEEMSFRARGLADVELRLAMGNLPKGVYELGIRPEDAATVMAEIQNATITGGSLTLADARFIKMAMEQAQRQQGINALAMVAPMIGQFRLRAQRQGQAALLPLVDELEKFLHDPRSLKISIQPSTPVPLHVFMGSAGTRDSAWLIRTLGLKVEANR